MTNSNTDGREPMTLCTLDELERLAHFTITYHEPTQTMWQRVCVDLKEPKNALWFGCDIGGEVTVLSHEKFARLLPVTVIKRAHPVATGQPAKLQRADIGAAFQNRGRLWVKTGENAYTCPSLELINISYRQILDTHNTPGSAWWFPLEEAKALLLTHHYKRMILTDEMTGFPTGEQALSGDSLVHRTKRASRKGVINEKVMEDIVQFHTSNLYSFLHEKIDTLYDYDAIALTAARRAVAITPMAEISPTSIRNFIASQSIDDSGHATCRVTFIGRPKALFDCRINASDFNPQWTYRQAHDYLVERFSQAVPRMK